MYQVDLRSGAVNAVDLTIFSAAVGTPGASWNEGDFNLDGAAIGADFLAWQRSFTAVGITAEAVPEPAWATLALIGLVAS